jgi:predicted transcriptional regulator
VAQITIYLDDEVLALVEAAAKASGISQSRWIAEAVRLRVKKEWPRSVLAMAGAWPDFPTAEEIRGSQDPDSSRE